MSKVAFVIDSSTYLPADLAGDFPISVTPLMLIWSGEELRDGVDIEPREFYQRLSVAKEMPSTSQPSPAVVKEHYDRWLAEGYEVLSVFISSKFSGTVASGEQALASLPDKPIKLVDSLTASMGVGWAVLAAARAAAKGADLAECKATVERTLEHTGIVLMVDTLEFLHRGGRIGGAKRFLGSLLNLKPILEVLDGAFEGIEQVRTRKKAMDRLVELTIQRIGGREPVRLAVVHANVPDTAQDMLARLKAEIKPIETTISPVSPAVGVHLGPGALGIVFSAGVE
jgi:DegV family protein with EDD domain